MTPVLLALVDMQLIGVSVSPWGFMFFWSLRTLPRLVHFIVCSMLSFFVMLIYVSYQRLSCHATITPIITSLPHYIIVSSPHVFFCFFYRSSQHCTSRFYRCVPFVEFVAFVPFASFFAFVTFFTSLRLLCLLCVLMRYLLYFSHSSLRVVCPSLRSLRSLRSFRSFRSFCSLHSLLLMSLRSSLSLV